MQASVTARFAEYLVGQRSDFGDTWSAVVSEWYLRVQPPVSEDVGWAALDALERHMPESIDAAVAQGLRGIAIIAPLVDSGITLLACEQLEGFEQVLRRLRSGQQASASELYVGRALTEVGYRPTLEPPLNENVLDASVSAAGRTVYMEVISPQLSEVMAQAYAGMQSVGDRLTIEVPDSNLDVYLFPTYEHIHLDSVVALAKDQAALSYSTMKDIPNVALVRYDPTQNPPAFPMPPAYEGMPVLVTIRSEGTRVAVHLLFEDIRVQRLMEAESHHFSPKEVNVLIIDVTQAGGGFSTWTPLIQRRFQPTINRRFGAVALYQSYTTIGGKVGRLWTTLWNEYAYQPVPQEFLDNLRRLNDPSID
jgi:hypothetical protein